MTKYYSLYIDDIRPLPEDGREWIMARTSKQAITYLKRAYMEFPINHISFDHDLGGDDTTKKVVHWLFEEALDNRFPLPVDFTWNVHSANPVGAQWLNLALLDLQRLVKEMAMMKGQYVE